MKKYGYDLGAVVVLLGTLTAAAAFGDEPEKPAAPVAPSLADVLTSTGITESGYVAASYYHSNGYNTYHEFDTGHDSFQLDQAAITLAYQPKEGFGAVVNVAAGDDMRI